MTLYIFTKKRVIRCLFITVCPTEFITITEDKYYIVAFELKIFVILIKTG